MSPSARRPAAAIPAFFLTVLLAAVLSACGGSDSTTSPATPDKPTDPVVSNPTPVALAAGGSHTCALSDSGRAYCWGKGQYGALGVGIGTTQAERPRAVAGGLVFTALSAGYVHTCGITRAGTAHCWGWNYERSTVRGALGDGTDTSRATPVAVAGGLLFRELAAGGHHSCGVATDNSLYCWGRNVSGELGTGDTTGAAQLRPVALPSSRRFRNLALGYRWTCGVDEENRATCWGEGAAGQLGYGGTSGRVLTPEPVGGGIRFVSLAAAQFGAHTCGVTTDSTAYCWGANEFGQLGDGSTTARLTPTPVALPGKVRAVGTGGFYSCALLTSGEVHCWGNVFAADRTGESPHPTPTRMAAPAGVSFAAIAVGANHACAMSATRVVYCWGAAGTVGDGSFAERPLPTPVAGFSTTPP